MNRREVVAGALATTAIAGIGTVAIPILYGDGIHDDSIPLRAYASGKDISFDGIIINARDGWYLYSKRVLNLPNALEILQSMQHSSYTANSIFLAIKGLPF